MAPAPKDPLLGTLVDERYRITEILGRGGMGVVYGGIHERLQRNVAIKVLGAAFSTDTVAAQRFLREARIASNLSHGNIVDVSDLGQLPDGRPFLVMPRVEGQDFADLLVKSGPFPPARVVELLRGVASALDLVHAKDLVHRDVKPENLMHVVRDDGSETVMLLDFGIATLVGPEVARLTAEGRIVGTPAYLPPELVSGEGGADGRGDIYALATVAFELITGRLPYIAENPLKLLPMKMNYDAPRMGLVTGQTFPDEVEAVIARGLMRDPARRPATAGELIAELDRAVRKHAPRPSDPAARSALTVAEEPSTNTISEAPLPAEREFSLEEDPEDAITISPSSSADDEVIRRTSLSVESAIDLPRSPARARALWAGLGLFALVAVALALVRGNGPAPQPATSTHRELSPAPSPPPAATFGGATPALRGGVASEPPPAAEPTVAPPPTPVPAGAALPPPAAEPTPPVRPHPGKRPRPAGTAVTPTPAPVATPSAGQLAAVRPAEPTADELNRQAAGELMQGHLARAGELYQRATQRDPRNAAAWRGLALSSERIGKRDAALAAYKRALKLTPPGPQADSLRARLQQLQGAP